MGNSRKGTHAIPTLVLGVVSPSLWILMHERDSCIYVKFVFSSPFRSFARYAMLLSLLVDGQQRTSTLENWIFNFRYHLNFPPYRREESFFVLFCFAFLKIRDISRSRSTPLP